jgi:hypothetical protein
LVKLNCHSFLPTYTPKRYRYYFNLLHCLLLQRRVARDLVLANLVFFLIDLSRLEVLLHSVLLALQMLLVTASRRPGAEHSAELPLPTDEQLV